jgi:hypothetical protein
VIGFNTEGLQAFLQVNANGTAPTPESNNKRGSKPRIEDLNAEPKAVFNDLVLLEKGI